MKSLQSQEDTTPQSESRFSEITHPYQAAAVSEEHQITSFPSSSGTPQATFLALHILEISLLHVHVSSELNRGAHDELGGSDRYHSGGKFSGDIHHVVTYKAATAVMVTTHTIQFPPRVSVSVVQRSVLIRKIFQE